MIYLVPKKGLPNKCYVAVSGGLDSMVLLHFLRAQPTRTIEVLHVNHSTPHGHKAMSLMLNYCHRQGISLRVETLDPREAKVLGSQEEWWRRGRRERLLCMAKQYLTGLS